VVGQYISRIIEDREENPHRYEDSNGESLSDDEQKAENPEK
jgi:hypothetical protein